MFMDQNELEKLKDEYENNEDLIQLYEDWGESPYLQEIFRLLDKHDPDWVKERELGSWAAEFILDILLEHEDELEEMSEADRLKMFEEEIEERYADFRSCHQFARVNNLSLRFPEDKETSCETLEDYIEEDGNRLGFPII